MTPSLGRYWRTNVLVIRRWWYDKDKAGDIALLTLVGLLAGRDLLTVSCVIAALYFWLGKLGVAIGIIPHGGHKTPLHNAVQLLGELALCALVPTIAWAVEHSGLGILAPIAALAVYLSCALAMSTFPDITS